MYLHSPMQIKILLEPFAACTCELLRLFFSNTHKCAYHCIRKRAVYVTRDSDQSRSRGYMMKLTTGGSTNALDAITVQPSFLDFFGYIHIILTEKVYLTPHLSYLVYFTLQTMKPSVLPPELSKTVYFTAWAVFSGGFQRVTVVLLQGLQ